MRRVQYNFPVSRRRQSFLIDDMRQLLDSRTFQRLKLRENSYSCDSLRGVAARSFCLASRIFSLPSTLLRPIAEHCGECSCCSAFAPGPWLLKEKERRNLLPDARQDTPTRYDMVCLYVENLVRGPINVSFLDLRPRPPPFLLKRLLISDGTRSDILCCSASFQPLLVRVSEPCVAGQPFISEKSCGIGS